MAGFPDVEWDPRRFGRAFRELTAGQSQEEIGLKMRYSGARIGQVQRGGRPSREFIERLVEAYAVDRKEWLELGGYRMGLPEPSVDEVVVRSVEEAFRRAGIRPLDAPDEPSGAEILMSGLADLAREVGRPIRIAFDEKTKAKLSPDEARSTLSYYRQEVLADRM